MTIYQKVIAAYGILRSAINSRMSKYDVAQEFRDSVTYAVGRLVIHEDKLYRCTTAHTGSWDANDFVRSTVDEAILYEVDKAILAASEEFAAKTDLAAPFSSSQSYDVNRLVVYNDMLYRCSVAHPAGDWDDGHFVAATVDDVISLNGGLRNIADDFDSSKSYSVGQLVVYENKLYRCTTAHAGDWSRGHFTTSTVEAALELMATKGELAAGLSGKIGLDKIASEFSEGVAYSVGQLVKKDGKLYRCTSGHVAGSWNSGADFTESPVSGSVNLMATKSELSALETSIATSLSGKIGLDKIASEFAEGTYSVGQLVRKDGKLYRCKTAHSGAWGSGNDFEESPVSVPVNDLISEVARRALRSELGYSGKSYSCNESDEVRLDAHDMEALVLHLSSTSLDQYNIHINLPDVEPEDAYGNFHAARCLVVIDATKLTDGDVRNPWGISIGSEDDTVMYENMSVDNHIWVGALNMLSLTYMGNRVWHCGRSEASLV